MQHKALCFMLALALGGVGVVQAQDTAVVDGSHGSFDGRWYVAPTVGGYYNDSDRNTNSRQFYYGIGVGKFLSANTSLDFFFDRTKRDIDRGAANGGGHGSSRWVNNNVGVALRYYLGSATWRPYLLVGALGSHHKNPSDRGWAAAAELGGGVAAAINDDSDVRIEAGYRYDLDDKSQRSRNGYGDAFLGLSIVSRFGAKPAAPAPVEAAPAPAPAPVE
ncbi:MAG: OmpA family protein, partial [Rhodanobacter sp.]